MNISQFLFRSANRARRLRFRYFALIAVILGALVSCTGGSNSSTGENTSLSGSACATTTVIYGNDDRLDLFRETDLQLIKAADSTVALMSNSDLIRPGDGTVSMRNQQYGQAYGLCSDEPFYSQPVAAFCTGFLIDPNTLLTAGHCITSDADCAQTSFVFGYSYSSACSAPMNSKESEIYSCRSVVHTQSPNNGADFAVVTLDRAVTGHVPLKARSSGTISTGDGVVILGHPSGLPLKIAGGANVRTVNPAGYFVANLDDYHGNSGSPVLNATTYEVEGILVRGEDDFVVRPGASCNQSKRCANDGCSGEDVTSIGQVLPYVLH